MTDKNLLFKQMEKITKLGVLIVIAFAVLTGIILQEGLSNGFQTENTHLYCATNSSENELKLKKYTSKEHGDIQEGKTLFLEKCASCHNINMLSDMTGPALGGAVDRWKNRADLYQWVQDYTVLVEQGHPRAVLMEQWSPSYMTIFSNLDTTQIRNIFAYVEMKAAR